MLYGCITDAGGQAAKPKLAGPVMAAESPANCFPACPAEVEKAKDRSLVDPTVEVLIKGMELFVDYKDVTFETLSQPEFFTQLKQAYPDIPWDKPFSEFKAAEEKPTTAKS